MWRAGSTRKMDDVPFETCISIGVSHEKVARHVDDTGGERAMHLSSAQVEFGGSLPRSAPGESPGWSATGTAGRHLET